VKGRSLERTIGATLSVHPVRPVAVRSELHRISLSDLARLWYLLILFTRTATISLLHPLLPSYDVNT